MLKRCVLLAAGMAFLTAAARSSTPKLIVVNILDQCRYEYLARFKNHFGNTGFLALLGQGADFRNASYTHAATLTGPGHAVSSSGIYGNQIGNMWFDSSRTKTVYCVDDDAAHLVGAAGDGGSPANLIGSTSGDEHRLCPGFQSKK